MSEDADPGDVAPAERPARPFWVAVAVNVVAALVIVSLVQAFLVRVHSVSSGSMEQTLAVTDRVLSSRLPYLTSPPARGDIVIFGHGTTWDAAVLPPDPNPLKQALRQFGNVTGIGISDTSYTVKRVLGVGGESVGCCDAAGRVQVNGVALDEPYVYEDLPFEAGVRDCTTVPHSPRCFAPIAVPAGKLLLLGDHRSGSADSVVGCRSDAAASDCARLVDVTRVTGKVIARAWPPGPVG